MDSFERNNIISDSDDSETNEENVGNNLKSTFEVENELDSDNDSNGTQQYFHVNENSQSFVIDSDTSDSRSSISDFNKGCGLKEKNLFESPFFLQKEARNSVKSNTPSSIKEKQSHDDTEIIVISSSSSSEADDTDIISDSISEITSNNKLAFTSMIEKKDDIKYVPESDAEISEVDESSGTDSSISSFSSADENQFLEESQLSRSTESKISEEPDEKINNSDINASKLSILSNTSGRSISISLFSNDGSQNSSLKFNSSSEEVRNARYSLEQQIADKNSVYQNLLRALRSCDTKKLRDGGKLLEEKMRRCKEELQDLKSRRSNASEEDNNSPEIPRAHTKSDPVFSTQDQVINNLGKKGLETHRIQAALTIDALVSLHGSLRTCPNEDTFESDPKGLRIELMPHQRHALAWLLWREQQQPKGGILADDMGLGKTLTMISLVLKSEEYKTEEEKEKELSLYNNNNRDSKSYPGKTLVICPASLVGQWEGQIKQHCKRNILQILVHHGKPRELQAKRLARFDIVITTYGVVAEENKIIEEKNRKGPLFRVIWERVILDEAHVIRNHKTQKAVATCELGARYRWCLTGTPVHNKELDIYSLLRFLRCSPFDDLVVWKRWVDNKSANGVERLNTVVKSILLRRTKDDLKEQGELKSLPTKEIIPIYIELDKDELKVYHKVLHFSKSLLAQYIHQREEKAGFLPDNLKYTEKLKGAGDIKTTEIFVLLLRLRQICCMPSLIHSMLEKETYEEEGLEDEDPILEDLFSQVKRMSISSRPTLNEEFEDDTKNVLVHSNPVFHPDRPSKKVQTVIDIVSQILETEDKVVIVSQWTGMLKKLHSHLQKLKVGIVTLDGTVPVKDRGKLIDAFNLLNSGPRIMLLSLNAGGVGLNLIGGNRLIIFEPHWNPQLESQACDRVYRVGQKKSVQIYKIICKDTIEERIELLQKKKLELANNVLKGEVKREMSKLTLQDLKTLFDVKSI